MVDVVQEHHLVVETKVHVGETWHGIRRGLDE